jgi:hypothetical protein
MTIQSWWNLGRNIRVENENGASWVTLIRDDLSQLTYSDEAFSSGCLTLFSWRPLKAFSPRMVRTGPSPLIRQVFERPVRLPFWLPFW